MPRLGISVYLDKSDKEAIYTYIRKAAELGYKRIFTCLLSMPADQKEQFLWKFKQFTEFAHSFGFTVSVDTNPAVFKILKATPEDIQPFSELGIDILRLDGNFGGLADVLLTHNPYNIVIEFNASHDMGMQVLLKNGANKSRITMCHNFFPERYSGLDFQLFQSLNKHWKSLHLPVAAFVTSTQQETVGPWPVTCGLPTVELFRKHPIDVQARYVLGSEHVDDVIIGNFPASDEELAALAKVDTKKVVLRVHEEDGCSPIEQTIMYDFVAHMDRQDRSSFMIRSAWTKGQYQTQSIPHRITKRAKFTRGDVLIVNDNLPHYRSELEIVLTEIVNDGERNLVATIKQEDLMLLDFIQPGKVFQFIK